ncbi:hypothetical protein DEU56DRAFT_714937, partial [Suillus clintonianus]|uniref:uncharacterized protein n=1 Tax=Suillus clintonianus TaxID=1904413 RepID=UPI001B878FE2
RYLFQCARTDIQESHSNFWSSVENSIEFVITRPNGWEGQQQQQQQQQQIAGLISSKEEQSYVHLLTDGEVIISEEDQSDSQGVIVVDAGGETIDLSACSMNLSPTSFEEIAPAECK